MLHFIAIVLIKTSSHTPLCLFTQLSYPFRCSSHGHCWERNGNFCIQCQINSPAVNL